MRLPAVSVVFLSYKQEVYVKEALLGALNQDLPAYELIIADDASPDSTVAVIESVLAQNPRPHVDVKFIKHGKNLGIVGNFNSALAAATGEIFVLMAGDDVSYPARARLMAEAFAQNPQVRAISCASRYVSADGVPIPARAPSLTTRTYQHGRWSKNIFAGAPVTGALAAYHRSILDVFGPLPPEAGVEDADSIIRALLLGRVMYYGTILVDYRMHGENQSNFDMRHVTDDDLIQREISWSSVVARNNIRWMRDLEVGLKAGYIHQKRFVLLAALVQRSISRYELTALSLGDATRSAWFPAAWRLIKCGGAVKVASLFFIWISQWRKYAHIKRVKRRKL